MPLTINSALPTEELPPKQRSPLPLGGSILKTRSPRFVSNMNARPDCELPQHLAAIGVFLLMADDALGWRAQIEGFR